MCDFHVGDSYLSFSKYAIGLEKYAMYQWYIKENETSQNHFGITLQKKNWSEETKIIFFLVEKRCLFSALLNFYQDLRRKILASQKDTTNIVYFLPFGIEFWGFFLFMKKETKMWWKYIIKKDIIFKALYVHSGWSGFLFWILC